MADLVFDPTLAGRSFAHSLSGPHCALSDCRPAGLTSKPHRAHREFPQLTWTVLPATGIGFQPQTRTLTVHHYRRKIVKMQAVFLRFPCCEWEKCAPALFSPVFLNGIKPLSCQLSRNMIGFTDPGRAPDPPTDMDFFHCFHHEIIQF